MQKRGKRFLAFCVAAALLLSLFIFFATPSAAAGVMIYPFAFDQAQVGEEISLSITVVGEENIGAYHIRILYDKSLVTCIAGADREQGGEALLVGTPEEEYGSSVLSFELTFVALSPGDAEFSVVPVQIVSHAGEAEMIGAESVCTVSISEASIPTANGKGDVDGDGEITSDDRTILARHLAHWPGYENVAFSAADVNGDSVVDSDDRTILARYIAHWAGYDVYFES